MKTHQILATVLLLFPWPLTEAADSAPARKIRFEEIGQKAGVRHLHHTRIFKGKKADVLGMFTSGGAAVAVGDYNNDGHDDLFVTDSDEGRPNALYRNNGDGTFTEVAAAAGVSGGNDASSIVSDALWFDYDNDGWQDLLQIRFGTSLLFHNEQNGKFKDVTAAAGMGLFANSVAGIAFDYDNDSRLDLVLGNYFKPESLLDLKSPHVLPNDLDNAVNGGGVTLWHNEGQGKFKDVTAQAGFSKYTGWTLDVGHGDFNGDGLQDLYLAADYGTDKVFFNNGGGTFSDVSEKAIGLDTKKGMNAEVADYDNDGWLDVYVTNITDEYMKECNMLWHNNGNGTFTDVSRETGTCDSLWGWGAKFADFDNDGWQDLFAVNGLRSAGEENYIPVLVNMIIIPDIDFTDVNNWPEIGNMSWSGFQKKKLFHSLAGQAFKEISAEAGVDNDLDGRGLAILDFDNDGLPDMYQANASQPSLLYRNRSENAGKWVQLKLVGTKSNRDAVGARVVLRAASSQQVREVGGAHGYSGQSSLRLHFGLAEATQIDSLEIKWPSGAVQQIRDVPLNRLTYIEEGRGIITPTVPISSKPK